MVKGDETNGRSRRSKDRRRSRPEEVLGETVTFDTPSH